MWSLILVKGGMLAMVTRLVVGEWETTGSMEANVCVDKLRDPSCNLKRMPIFR
jgi:hypothetical protein